MEREERGIGHLRLVENGEMDDKARENKGERMKISRDEECWHLEESGEIVESILESETQFRDRLDES